MTAHTIHQALEHHQQGRLAEAESIYRELLNARSNDADALHYLGVLRMRQGRREEAIELVKHSLRVTPRNADAWNNLGNMLSAGNDPSATELAYLHATNLKPEMLEPWYNLGNLMRRQQRREEAVRYFQRVIELNPRFAAAYENLAVLLQRMGRPDLAAEAFRGWHRADPSNPIARHMAAAGDSTAAPPRADDAYVVTMFDRGAEAFDKTLAGLQYAAPSLLAAALADFIPFAEQRLAVLDAGCGTGLCAPLLRSSARLLAGVDLSAGMLAKARERNIYDELHEAELVAFMRSRPASYDLVISADTLVYFGALEEALSAAATALKPGGILAFTLEAEVAGSGEKYRLHSHGRYTHSEEYVRACLAAARFDVLRFEPGVLRKEGGTDVPGHVVIAKWGHS